MSYYCFFFEFSDGEQQVLPVVPNATFSYPDTSHIHAPTRAQTFSLNAPERCYPHRLTRTHGKSDMVCSIGITTINTPQTDNVTEITASYYVSTHVTAIANANPQITNTIRQWMQKPDATLTSPLEKNRELKSILLQLSPG